MPALPRQPQLQKGGLRLDSRESAAKRRRERSGDRTRHIRKKASWFERSTTKPTASKCRRPASSTPNRSAADRMDSRGRRLAREFNRQREPFRDTDQFCRTGRSTGRSSHCGTRSFHGLPSRLAAKPVDSFLAARQQGAGCGPAAPAERRTLLRRVTFDLTGFRRRSTKSTHFWPTIRRAPMRRSSTGSSRRRITASAGPGTGSISCGSPRPTGTNSTTRFRQRGRIATTLSAAFNDDLPYNQFVTEHIAGDLLSRAATRPARPYERVGRGDGVLVVRAGRSLSRRSAGRGVRSTRQPDRRDGQSVPRVEHRVCPLPRP